MNITCNKCGERFSTGDVVIKGGRIECPGCKAGMLLDLVIATSPAAVAAEAPVDDVQPRLPGWIRLQEVGNTFQIGWPWSQGKAGSHWLYGLLYGVLAGVFTAMTIQGFGQSAPIVPLLAAVAAAAAAFGIVTTITVSLINSTVICFDGETLTVRNGPIARRSSQVRLSRRSITRFSLERRGNEVRYDYSVIGHTVDGERVVLENSLRDRAAARLIRRRLNEPVPGGR